MKVWFFLVALIFISAPSAWSAPTIDCHCFRDRQFDPQNPSAVDDYVLATCQNSLVAAIFKIEKKPIVQARMTGVSSRQVWISQYLSSLLGQSPADWLSSYAENLAWEPVLAKLPGHQRKKLNAWFLDASEETRAERLVNRLLGERLALSNNLLRTMRNSGADDKKIIAASVLGRLAEVPPDLVLKSVQQQKKTWGEWVVEAGLEPVGLGDAIRGLVVAN